MRVWYADHQVVELPAGHRFPMGKYRALRLFLVAEGILEEAELLPAPSIDRVHLERVHEADYVAHYLAGTLDPERVRRIGFPWSPAMVRRSLASAGGTLAACRDALIDGISGTLAGGTHHAFREGGAGYCVFNDIAVALQALLAEGRIGRALVFDVDVHQGDGTAAIFAGDPRVFTASVHGARNFPLRKQQGDLDVPLPDGTADAAYLDAVEGALARSLAAGPFDLCVVQGGVDGLAVDRLGRLDLSEAGLLARDRLVLSRLHAEGIPVALTLGGGYAEPIEAAIRAHANTWRVAAALRHPEREPRLWGRTAN